MLDSLRFNIRWHFEYNWMLYLIAVIILALGAACWYGAGRMSLKRPPVAVVTVVHEGTVTNIRATGAWENWCKIELKFDDGTVVLTSYGFIRKYKIKEGHRYAIKDHSRYGRIAVKL